MPGPPSKEELSPLRTSQPVRFGACDKAATAKYRLKRALSRYPPKSAKLQQLVAFAEVSEFRGVAFMGEVMQASIYSWSEEICLVWLDRASFRLII